MLKRHVRILAWSLILSLGGFLFGFDTAVISGVEKTIQQLFNLTPLEHGFAISSALLGTVAGALFSGRPADRYGRRPVLFVIGVLFAVSAAGSALAPDVTWFIIFRFMGGIAVGASSVVAPMLISEISPAAIRGRMTALFQFNVIFGILIAYVSNYLLRNSGPDSWRWMLAAGGFPAVVWLFLLFLVPESPRFLALKGKTAEAARILRLADPDLASNGLDEISPATRQSRDGLFSGKFNKPVALAILVAMFNQFSGINAILYYAPRIFELSGLSSADSMLQPVVIGAINGLFTMIGLVIIDRAGRRKLLITGSIGMAICLGLAARAFYQQSFQGYSLLVLLAGYIMFFAFSTGAVIWVLISEVFPTSVRGQGQSLGSFTHWFFAALVTFLFPALAGQTETGAGHAFLFFSVAMIIQAIVVWRYFPETKGKTLEQLGAELSPQSGVA